MAIYLYVQNEDRKLDKPPRVKYCYSFRSKLRGMMFRRNLPPDEGLVLAIEHDTRLDSSIHMLFVPFDLAVFWINMNMEIVDKVLARSWRPAYFPARPAAYVLEVHPDHFADYEIGQKVEFQHV